MSDVMIEVQDLTKIYGTYRAIDKVSFEVRKGEVLGFLGPNGAGKTTTMKILTCFIAPTDGSAKVNGCDVFEDSLGVRKAIGYLPESTPLYVEMMVLEYLEWAARIRGLRGEDATKAIRRVVEETSLGDVLAKEIRELSKGYRQRVGLAQALIHLPPILILDEPMSGLDPNQAIEIRDLITNIGKERTVILSTHNLAEVQVSCDRAIIIAKGKVVADATPRELLEQGGKSRVLVSFLKNGKTDGELREMLGKVSGADLVRPIDSIQGEIAFEVVPTGSTDIRPSIFRAAVDNNVTLIGLRQEGQNLENIFRDLTTAEPSGKAKSKSERPAASESKDA